jgi:signal transduction histidine kinase
MLRRSNQDHALAFSCDADGAILEVLHDARGFFPDGRPDILGLMPDVSQANFRRFLATVQAEGHSLFKEIILARDGREFAFSLFGMAKNGRICLLAVQSPKQIFLIYDEFMAIINEQARSLREEQKKSSQTRSRICAGEKGLLEDYMKLNNELANMQRELSIAHLALQGQEKRFRDLVTFSPDAQVVLDDRGRMLFFNPAAERILGLSGGAAIGSVFALDLRGEKEFCLRSANGRTCVEVRHTVVSWEGGPATLFSLRDITERKQVEQIKDDVGRILQHDLISPLNPIVSLPQLLMDDTNITEDQRRILGMISTAGMRMLNMIRLSLNLYKMENGSFEFTPEPVDLVGTVRDILADLSDRARARKVLVRIALDGRPAMPQDDFWALAEPNLCYSMFSNLLLNAIEASPQGGLVAVDLSRNGRACASIRNAGAVPEDIRATFFEKYVTSGKPQGTGLGTYSARLIAQTLGGEIRMETSEEHGTTVTVEIPAAAAPGPSAAPGARQRVPAAAPPSRPDPGQAPLGRETLGLMSELRQELSLHSYGAVALADTLLQRSAPGTPESQAFERIARALDALDFASAAATLDRSMPDDPDAGGLDEN